MKTHRIHFPEISSTNSWAKQHANELPRNALTLITADSQTAGRGRMGNRWISPAGMNLYASYLFFSELDQEATGCLAHILALSASHALEAFGVRLQIKWPNDLLLDQKKIAGILCETGSIGRERFLVAGIGINVNMPEDELKKIDRPATSLAAATGDQWETETLLEKLTERWRGNLALFLKKGFSPFLSDYRSRLQVRQGDPMRFHTGGKLWEGSFESVDEKGALRMRLASGESKEFHSGEIL